MSNNNKKRIVKALAVAAITVISTGLASLPTADAATYILSACNGSLGCGTTGNNYGTVTTSADGTDTVKIEVNLAAGVEWVGGGHAGFAFYLPTITGVTLTNAPAGSVLPSALWTPNTNGAPLLTPSNTDGFKSGGSDVANFGLDVVGSGATGDSSPLIFDITATGLLTSSFHSWFGSDHPTTPVYFIADLCVPGTSGACEGKTGLVGATFTSGQQELVPLPATAWLMGSIVAGGAGFGAWRKRRKKEKQTA